MQMVLRRWDGEKQTDEVGGWEEVKIKEREEKQKEPVECEIGGSDGVDLAML